MSAIDDLIQALEALKQKPDGTILYAAEVHDLVDGIFAAMEMGGTPIKGATATELQPDETPTAELTPENVLVLGIPKGEKGDNGERGETGADGKSAYQVWLDEGNEGSETDFLNSLKAHVSRFIPIATEAGATSLEVGDSYAFSNVTNPTDGAMLLMPNGDTTTPKTLMFAVSEDTNTPGTYIYTYIGELTVDTTGLLGIGDVDGSELTNPTPSQVAKAVDVAVIKSGMSEEFRVWSQDIGNSRYMQIDTSTNKIKASDTSYQNIWYIAVEKGDVVKVQITLSGSKAVRWGFCQNTPAVDEQMTGVQSKTNTALAINAVSPYAGYFVVNFSTNSITYTQQYSIVRMSLPDKIKKSLSDAGYFFAKDEDITAVVSSLPKYNMIIGGNTGNWASDSGRYHVILDATGIGKITVNPSSDGSVIAFLTSHETPLTSGESPDYVAGTGLIIVDEERTYKVPEGTKYICFNRESNTANYMPSNVVVTGRGYTAQLTAGGVGVKTIYPVLRYGTLGTSGAFDNENTYTDRKMVVTPRYFKTAKDFTVTPSLSCKMQAYCFNDVFAFIGVTPADRVDVVAGTSYNIEVLPNTSYVKLAFSTEEYETMPQLEVSVEGYFGDDWDVFNERPADSGYHKIKVVVNVTNPTCCDSVTNAVQDEATFLCDYGVICLPETYSNTGRATRLIIYCHGSAVDYTSGGNGRFNTVDLQPEYWLKEGYAVMDMDGDPFTDAPNSQSNVVHGTIPQSVDCYVAGYKWAIEHYNLRRDGVFIGGRSLGSRMCLLLSREQVPIPVIACCPNAGPNVTGATWNYSNDVRRGFMANHMGFVNQPTWTSNSPMSQTEWDCLKENYDKLVKNGIWSIIVDLPDADALFASALNISKNASTSQAEWEFYSFLHARVGCPVKIFGCNQDETSPMTRGPELTYKMLVNGGVICELRKFNSTMDYSGTGTTAHHYDTQDPSLRAAVTTRYGEQLTNVPIVYIEMLQFWRRFEQEN